MNRRLPNLQWLALGAGVTLLFCIQLLRTSPDGIWLCLTGIAGLPVAFLYLLFTNPKDCKGNGWHIVIAMPACAALWPIFLIVLLLSPPWKDRRWLNRDSIDA